MYLFQLVILPKAVSTTFIYIPLCIYFNLTIIPNCGLMFLHLHSTMYLFQPAPDYSGDFDKLYLHSTMYLFQHAPHHSAYKNNCNLHSTMYLFQLVNSIFGSAPELFTFHYVSISTLLLTILLNLINSIYIPLCIYFNIDNNVSLWMVLVFTFHYVSISTGH